MPMQYLDSYQRLVRSSDNKRIAGVAGGLGTYFGIDPTLIRIAFVLLALTGITFLAYPLLWMIMPRDESASDIAESSGPGLWSIMLKAAVIVVSFIVIAEIAEDFTVAGFAVGLMIGLFFVYRGIAGAMESDDSGTGLYRSASDRKIMGVFGGLGDKYEIDPTLLRIGAAVALLVGFPLLVPAYLIYAMIVPERTGRIDELDF